MRKLFSDGDNNPFTVGCASGMQALRQCI